MPPEQTFTEIWQIIQPYAIAIISGLAGLAVAILAAAAIWVKAVAKKEDTHVKKEVTYLDLVNNLLAENKETKIELAALRSHLDQLQADIFAAKEREIEREKEFLELMAERDSLKKELESIRLELEKMRAEIQRLTDERDALNEKLENERSLRRDAELARIQVEAEREKELSRIQTEREKERTALNSRIETLQTKVAVLEQSIALLNSKPEGE